MFLFLSYSFRINTFINSRSSLENHTRFQTKMGQVYTRFQTETAQTPTRWGGTYLDSLYKGVPPGTSVYDIGGPFFCNYVIQLTLTLKRTTARVVETSVTVNNNSPIQDDVHPDDQTQPTLEMTLGFKPFTALWLIRFSLNEIPSSGCNSSFTLLSIASSPYQAISRTNEHNSSKYKTYSDPRSIISTSF